MRILVSVAVFAFIVSKAYGQGLLSIGPQLEVEGQKPWTATIGATAGWDSNPGAGQEGNTATGSHSGQGSAYLQGDVNFSYAMQSLADHLQISGDYSDLWYAKPVPGVQTNSSNWRISGDYSHQDSSQLTVSDTFYLAHQTQPDPSVGIGINRPTDSGSLIGYSGLQVKYAWSRVLSTVTGYSITGTDYEDASLRSENFVDQLFSEEVRYIASRRSTLTGAVRYEITQHRQNKDADSRTLFVLAGIDHQFNPRWQGSLTGGAQFRQYSGPQKSNTAPYVEASMNYNAGKNTMWRWYANLGLNDTGNAGNTNTQSGYSYRTGLSFQEQLTPRLALNISLNYQWTNYSADTAPQLGSAALTPESPVSAPSNSNQQTISASANLSYLIWRNVSLTAGYSFTDVTGVTSAVSAYERQQITMGMSATF